MTQTTKPAILLLSDGTLFEGIATGANAAGYSIGEVVFNTGMSGYQEVATDPSYSGQLICFTYPHIGNYGANEEDLESATPAIRGVIVREMVKKPSNQRATCSFPDWLEKHNILGIEEIDTRALTKHVRERGVMMGIIVHDATKEDAEEWLQRLQEAPGYGDVNYIDECSVIEPTSVIFKKGEERNPAGFGPLGLEFIPYNQWLTEYFDGSPATHEEKERLHVVVIDYGTKWSIFRSLLERGFRVTAVPYTTPLEEIEALQPDGILISNGPGDPSTLVEESRRMKEIALKYPTFGICLGHQLLTQAFGGKTFKLRYGHRGPNQPVFERATETVLITSQNHGYAAARDSFPDSLIETSSNLNDDTVSGLRHKEKPIFSVQYHPEAGPGPNDAKVEFDLFVDMIVGARASAN